MAHVRTVTGIMHRPDGSVWPDYQINFALAPTANAGHAILPYATVIAKTDADGAFSVTLEVGVPIIVDFYTSTTTSNGASYVKSPLRTIVVPEGGTPISLMELFAQDNQPVPPSLTDIVVDQIQPVLDAKADTAALLEHTTDTTNPHGVTAAQVGLGNVANLAPADLPVSDATQDALDLKADDSVVAPHIADTSNPHGVTKAQVGLGSVDNTSDADKPVSTATANALALKANISSLGTAAAANVGDFATAAQGALADTAVQPSPALTDAIDQRHEHANKALLDTVTPELLVPGGGVAGQVLTVGGGDTTWGWRPGGLMSPSTGPYYLSPVNQGLGRASSVNVAIPANRLVAVPMPIYRPATLTRFWCAVTTAAAEGGVARVAICRSATPGGNPTTVIAEDVMGIDTTGVKEVVGLSAVVGVEDIWLVFLPSDDVTVQGASAVFSRQFNNVWTTTNPGLSRDGVEFDEITSEKLTGNWQSQITNYPALAVRT